MKKRLALFGVGLLMLLIAGTASAYDPIINYHGNDVNGVADSIGAAVNMRGTITAEFTTSTANYMRAFLQDGTAGINLYKYGMHTCFLMGDDVEIWGVIAQYNGLTEAMPDSFVIHGGGGYLPELIITIPELNGSFKLDFTEPHEGRLVKIKEVWTTETGNWASGSYTITDGVNSGTMYIYGGSGCAIHPLIGQPIPAIPFDVVGILTQYDWSSPHTSGYQISPRGPWDIVIPPTAVEESTWGRIKTLFR
jgi:hypothetical protein